MSSHPLARCLCAVGPLYIVSGIRSCVQPITSNYCVQMRYANNSNYKNDTMIRKEAIVSKTVINELRRILEDSEVRLELSVQLGCWSALFEIHSVASDPQGR